MVRLGSPGRRRPLPRSPSLRVAYAVYFSPLAAIDSAVVPVPAPHNALLPHIALLPHNPLLPHSALDAELPLDPHIAEAPHSALEPHRAEVDPTNTDGPHTFAAVQFVVDPHSAELSLTR